MKANSEPIVIYCAFGSLENAHETARQLINKKLAACVNVLPEMQSFYEWNGEPCEDGEILLIAKSTKDCVSLAIDQIIQLHNYDEPGVVCLPITGGSSSYLEWISKQTQTR